MKHIISFVMITFFLMPSHGAARDYTNKEGVMQVAVVHNPYSGSRSGPELSKGPEILSQGGLDDILTKIGCVIKKKETVSLTVPEEKDYGVWHRLGLANGHLGKMVSSNERNGIFTIGLLSNCNSLMGMLAGLQHSGPGRRPLKVGLVWIDAHGDFNTPETTLSGMLGGMPVAVSAGLCLTRLRLKSGLDPALPTRYIVMAGVRDTDPLEKELIDRSDIEMLSVNDIKNLTENIHARMRRLERLTDIIYVHIDMDVLDPEEVSGHSLTVANGPTSRELAAALELMFKYKKTAAIGIASYPAGKDKNQLSKKAAYNLITGAIKGVRERQKQ